MKQKLTDYLSHGAENGVTLPHLSAMIGLPARQVRQLIQAERLQGTPILSETQEDVEQFYRSMLHRAAEITRVATAVKLRGRRLD